MVQLAPEDPPPDDWAGAAAGRGLNGAGRGGGGLGRRWKALKGLKNWPLTQAKAKNKMIKDFILKFKKKKLMHFIYGNGF